MADAETDPDPLRLVLFKCPACSEMQAVETHVRFGRSSYYCTNCQHAWDIPPLEMDPDG